MLPRHRTLGGGCGAVASRCWQDVVSWSGAGAGGSTCSAWQAAWNAAAPQAGQPARHEGQRKSRTLATKWATHPKCMRCWHMGQGNNASGPTAPGDKSQRQTGQACADGCSGGQGGIRPQQGGCGRRRVARRGAGCRRGRGTGTAYSSPTPITLPVTKLGIENPTNGLLSGSASAAMPP